MKPDKIEKRNRQLPTCAHGDCAEHCVWDSKVCWKHLSPTEQTALQDRVRNALRNGDVLRAIVLSGVNLRGFDFSRVDFSHAFLDDCDLRECKFVEAKLVDTYLGWSDLRDSDLTRANLKGAVFSGANLENVKLLGYSLVNGSNPINLEAASFGKHGLLKRPKINEESPDSAEVAYRRLKAYFSEKGDYDSASWASYSERRMGRQVLWSKSRYAGWISSIFFALTTGYGEKPLRVILFASAVIIVYAFAYSFFGLITPLSSGWSYLANAVYFSTATFCTFSALLLSIADSWLAKALVSSEAFLGVFTMGLFIFTLTRRFVAR